jgi:hypothetical protein
MISRAWGRWVPALLLAASLVWAYRVAHPPAQRPSVGRQAVTVWEVPLDQVKRLSYRAQEQEVTLSPEGEAAGAGPYLWIETRGGMARPPPAQRGKSPPPVPLPPAAFKGSQAAVELLRSFATLKASRDLGPLAGLEGAVFGLPAPDNRIELDLRSGEAPLRLELGRTSYGGAQRYVHASRDGRLYLVQEGLLRRLSQAPGALMDRELLDWPKEDQERPARLEVRKGGLHKTFFRLAEGGGWSETPEGGAVDADVAGLLATAQRLKVLRYDPEGTELPAPLLELRLSGGPDDREEASLRIHPGDETNLRAVSSYTRRAVLLPRRGTESLFQQAEKLLGGT